MRPEAMPEVEDDEIDLAELGAGLLAHGRTILAVAAIGIGLSATYATVIARPSYEASAVFAFNGAGAKGALGNLGGLAALAGLPSGGGSDDKLVFDRVTSADFILGLADKAGLRSDPYFNPSLGVGRREKLLAMAGLSSGPKSMSPTEIDAAIVGRFRKSVTLTATKNAAITAKVVHMDAERAAVIANAVVDSLLADTLDEQMDRSRSEVEYLGEQLAEVQAEMDAAVGRLQEFSISRNALSVEDLLRRSSQLVQLRETRDGVEKMRAGVVALLAANSSADELREVEAEHPVLLSTEFRLQAGLGSSQVSLDGLGQDRLGQILEAIEGNLAKLDGSIRSAEENAKLSAEEAAELLRLQREVKVQEATYEAVVEQYKSRSISGGFQDALGTMLQSAVPPIEPSAPKVSLILALGAVIGLIAGSGIAILRSLKSGVLYTRGAVLSAFGGVPSVITRVSGRKVTKDAVEVAGLLSKGGVRNTVLWQLGEGSKGAFVAEAAAAILTEAGIRTAIVSLDPTLRGGTKHIEVEDTASKALRGTLAAEIEALTAQSERVIILGGGPTSAALILPSLSSLVAPVVAYAEPKVTNRAQIAQLLGVAKPSAVIVGC